MQPSDTEAYGCDYSAREYTPEQMDQYPDVRIEWLARYIGYPANAKCISHYPGAYRAHTKAGRPVALYHQIGYRDFQGGYASGVAQAQTALSDAKSQGWDGETPIIASRRISGVHHSPMISRLCAREQFMSEKLVRRMRRG